MTCFYSPNFACSGNQFEHIIKKFDKEGTRVGDSTRNVIKYFNINGTDINFKSFRTPNFFNKIVYSHFRKSKARRSFENALFLLSKGLDTPEPVAYLEYYDMLGLNASYYISRQLDDVVELRTVLVDPHFPDRENILRKYTTYFFYMHEHGIEFLDNSPGNSLVKKSGDEYIIYLVDLNRMRFKNSLSITKRMQNFARLTTDKSALEIIAREYARFVNVPSEDLLQQLVAVTHRFRETRLAKKNFKKKVSSFKKMFNASLFWASSLPENICCNPI